MSGVVRIEMWTIKNGFLEGVVTNWERNPDHCINHANGKAIIRTSRIKRRQGSMVETIGGSVYRLMGLSRNQLIQQAKSRG